MASLGGTFVPSEVPPDEFTPLPAGEYLAQIISSEIKDTKTGTGQMLNLSWEIVTGPMEGRMIFDRINIRNQNEKAQAIGLRQLANICEALGVPHVDDSEELHHRPLKLVVVIEEDKSGQYGPQNRIKKYAPANGTVQRAAAPAQQKAAPPPAQRQTATTPPVQQKAAAGARPWVR